jgi:hypothetical protein
MIRQIIFGMSILVLIFSATQALTAEDDGFVSLFDGKTLKGFTHRNGVATYRVENGAIVGRTALGSPNSFLCTNQAYCDFELLVEVKVDPVINSGIQIRSRSSENYRDGRVHGPQVEIEAAPGRSGYIYSEATGRNWLSPDLKIKDALKNDRWNHYRILAVGPRIQTWINGVPVEDLTDKQSSKCGFIGFQVHSEKDRGPFEVRWRNMKIKDLSPEKAAKSQDVQFQKAPDVQQ